jgi:hypothetical protein
MQAPVIIDPDLHASRLRRFLRLWRLPERLQNGWMHVSEIEVALWEGNFNPFACESFPQRHMEFATHIDMHVEERPNA